MPTPTIAPGRLPVTRAASAFAGSIERIPKRCRVTGKGQHITLFCGRVCRRTLSPVPAAGIVRDFDQEISSIREGQLLAAGNPEHT